MTVLHHRLYAWLPVLVIGVVVLIVMIGVLFARTLEQELLTGTGERLAVAASDVTEKLDRLLFERYGDIRILAGAGTLQGRDPAAIAAFLNDIRTTYYYYEWLGVTDAKGRLIAATDPGAVGRDVAATDWFQAVRAGQAVYIQNAHRSPEAPDMEVVAFTAPLLDAKGRFLGALTTRVALPMVEDIVGQTVVALLAQHGTSARVEYQLLRADGELIADSSLREEGRANLVALGLPSAQLAASAPAGFVEEEHLRRHVPVITGYARTKGFEAFPGFGWLVLVRMDKEDILVPVTDVLRRLGLLGGIGLLPLLGLLFWATTRLRTEWRAAVQERDRAVTAEAALADRIRALDGLVETTRQLTAESEMNRLLRAVVETAQRLTGARYAALSLLDKTGTQLVDFLTVGLDDDQRRAMGSPPTGKGLLSCLTRETTVLRLRDLTQHPAFSGFPPHHPPMRSFLGASIHTKSQLWGRLYLTDKMTDRGYQQGVMGEFTELDEQIVAALAIHAGLAVEKNAAFQEVRDAGEELKRVNASLRAATQELEDMTSIIAHDLKSPLVTIQGYAGRIEALWGGQLDDKGRRYLAVIQEVGKTLGLMVDGLLDVSRIRGRSWRAVPCAVSTVIEKSCAALGEQISTVGATVRIELDPTASLVLVDPVAFSEILGNLLTNALKFRASQRPPSILIGSRGKDQEVVMWVQDNGIGIPAARRHDVFQIFRKLDRNTSGVGIGLAAVKKLVQQAGGRVWIESEPGQGATVLFTLPRASAP